MTTQLQKRVAITGGVAGLSSWGRVWGDVWGKTWDGAATPIVGAHPTVDVLKRVTGVITEVSTKRVPTVDPPDFV